MIFSLPKLMPAACAAVAALFCSAVNGRADTFLMLDLTSIQGNTVGPVTSGYDAVTASFLANTPTASISNIDGTGISFSINNVGSYNAGQGSTEPLTTAGFYTFGNNNNDHTFTLSGLTLGSTVTMYATSAWDGTGRGAVIAFGGSTVQAKTIGDPGTAPTLANFTMINAAALTVGSTGIVTGTMNGAGGVNTATEGQLGAIIFDIAPAAAVPEPSTYVLMLLAGIASVGVVVQRRRLAKTATCG